MVGISNVLLKCVELWKRKNELPFKDNAEYLVSGAMVHPSRAQEKEFFPDVRNLWSPFYALITQAPCHCLTAVAENSTSVINHEISLHMLTFL